MNNVKNFVDPKLKTAVQYSYNIKCFLSAERVAPNDLMQPFAQTDVVKHVYTALALRSFEAHKTNRLNRRSKLTWFACSSRHSFLLDTEFWFKDGNSG